jgi:uncharacterized membrane protein
MEQRRSMLLAPFTKLAAATDEFIKPGCRSITFITVMFVVSLLVSTLAMFICLAKRDLYGVMAVYAPAVWFFWRSVVCYRHYVKARA